MQPARCSEVCSTADQPRRAPFSGGSKTDLTRRGGEVIQCQERFPFSPPLTALCHSTPHQPLRDAWLLWLLMHALGQGKFCSTFYLRNLELSPRRLSGTLTPTISCIPADFNDNNDEFNIIIMSIQWVWPHQVTVGKKLQKLWWLAAVGMITISVSGQAGSGTSPRGWMRHCHQECLLTEW